MSPLRPSKRRRLDHATHTLSQPFKSPFKTPLKPTLSAATNLPTPTSSPAKEDPFSEPTKITAKPTTSPRTPNPSSTKTPLNHPRPKTTALTTTPCAEYNDLQKRHTRLLNDLSTARTTLSTTQQALKILSTTRDADLTLLIQKWKLASRAAAEEVFAKARDRVNKMGGVGALREKERERMGGGGMQGWGWDERPADSGGGGGGGDDEDDEGEEGRDREEEEDGAGFRRGEYEGDNGKPDAREEGARKADEGGGDDDEGYTIDMMLKTLSIELEVIGYDKELGRWVD